MKEIMKWKDKVFLVLIALVFIRLIMIGLSYNYGMRYVARQLIYTAAWAQIANFLCNYRSLRKDDQANIVKEKKMKNLSFWTMIICLIRTVVFIISNWPLISNMVWPSIYNVLEPLAWIMLSSYFFLVYKSRRDQINRISN